MRAVWRYPVLALAALGALGIPNPARAQNAAAHNDSDYNNFLELNIYGGYSDYKKIPDGLGGKIQDGAILGGRVTENFWNYVGIEESFNAYSWNKYDFLSNPTDGVALQPPFPIHTLQPAVDLIVHLTPRDHRFRPFVAVGAGGTWDVLGKNATKWAASLPPGAGFGGFTTDERFQGNYGAGIKFQANKWFGLRFDVRGLTGIGPRFGLPSGPPSTTGAYIPNGSILNGIQVTGGMTLYLGHRGEAPPPPTPPPPPPARVQGAINAGSIMANPTSVCPGDAVQLSSDASDPEGHQLTYEWTANGTQIGTGAQYSYRPSSSGNVQIGLHVADATNSSRGADASAVTIHVNTYSAPVVSSVTADPSTLDRGQTAALHATAMGSECSGTLTYSWAAAEGAVSGSGPDATFNSSSVTFNEGDRSRPQSKQVMITATVTDSKGGSGNASTEVTVNLGPEAKHFGDILFPKYSARVNNCGKRVLIEQLYPQLTANPNYDVVLVGHIDPSEVPRGRGRRARGRDLDRERVLQTAAVLSGGSGTCSSLDVSRIRGVWVGTNQVSESVPTSCALSTTAPKERRGQAIEDTNEAKNRRVEIWLVPKGMALPAAATGAMELPDNELKRIGCPK
ncbi:MAG TPA: PKD domain-containing protein [Bryobacteraceae bacterium]|nr:PKD domain-containing protein [Bryobacteraceae bacterium]